MGPASWSGAADTPAAPAVRDGVVSRPGLFGLLGSAGRVTEVSAAAGSGKTLLLRSWIGESGLTDRSAWVAVQGEERDPQRFWLSVLGALRDTAPGSKLVRPLTAAPDLDGWAVVERLLSDLGGLEDQVWLVIDDVHELRSDEALRQLELLVMRAPARLRFLLATRRDLRLGLHRLRLEGELTEIRAADLRFSLAETRELFAAAGIELPDAVAVMLHERTEGWAAGLRLAALSLAGHPDPGRFATEFSGSERTVAEYLLAEVLDRQGERVRRLLSSGTPQAPVPAQQRARCHNPVQPQVPRQETGQGGEHGTVSPVRPRPRDLPAQDRDLMPQHEDLRILSGVIPCQEHQPAEHPDHQQVDETDKHKHRT